MDTWHIDIWHIDTWHIDTWYIDTWHMDTWHIYIELMYTWHSESGENKTAHIYYSDNHNIPYQIL